jgi:DNA-binding GntR family transcriptional regulator
MADIIDISRGALHDQLTQRLRTLLVEGRIAPGAKLNERELCEALHVSRTPLREAIKRLAAEGLVDLLPNRGAVAVKLTEADVVHAFEVLAGAGRPVGRTGGRTRHRRRDRRDPGPALRDARLPRAAGPVGLLPAECAHPRAINAAARNPVLTQTYAHLNARVQALRFRTNQDSAKWQRAVLEHEQHGRGAGRTRRRGAARACWCSTCSTSATPCCS